MSSKPYVPNELHVKFLNGGEDVEVHLDGQVVPGRISGLSLFFRQGEDPIVEILLGGSSQNNFSEPSERHLESPEDSEILDDKKAAPSESGITPMGNDIPLEKEHLGILVGYYPGRKDLFGSATNGEPIQAYTLETSSLFINGEASVNALIKELADKEKALVDDTNYDYYKIISPPHFILDTEGNGIIEEKVLAYDQS